MINNLEKLVASAQQNLGISLEQDFYCNPEIHELELAKIFTRLWMMVGHASRIPEPGQYFLYGIGRESVIIIRESETKINAFHNVCRHRGSRICLEQEGKKNLLTCPYHAWSYALDGSLKAANYMPDGFNREDFRLHPCHIQVFEGLIFINLSQDEPPDLETLYGSYHDFAEQQGLARAKIANMKSYPTRANWKLVIENFFECYHCAPSHPEYSAVHDRLKILARGAGKGTGPEAAEREFAPVFEQWETESRAMGHLTGVYPGGNEETGDVRASRTFIQKGFQSETMDGKPACKVLMGNYRGFDGGVTVFVFNPMSIVQATNDFAVMTQFTPRGVLDTDVTFIWLVDEKAQEGVDYDPEDITFFWDVTTRQDKTITENNQAGVLSGVYRPGPYSIQEANLRRLKTWYLQRLSVN